MNYTVYITNQNYLKEYQLCLNDKKKCSIELMPCENQEQINLCFEVSGSDWYAVSGSAAAVLDNRGHEIMSARLYDGFMFSIRTRKTGKICSVLMRRTDSGINKYILYSLEGRQKVTIGSRASSDICINSHCVNEQHACITEEENCYYIETDGKGEVYVNLKRVLTKQCIHKFDVIYLPGIKIIFIEETAAVSCSDSVRVGLDRYKGGYEKAAVKKQCVISEPLCNDIEDISPVVLIRSHAEIARTPKIIGNQEVLLASVITSSSVMFICAGYFDMRSVLFVSGIFAGLTASAAMLYSISADVVSRLTALFRRSRQKRLDDVYVKQQLTLLDQRVKRNAQILNQRYRSALHTAGLRCSPDELRIKRSSDDFLKIRIGSWTTQSQIELTPYDIAAGRKDELRKILQMNDVPLLLNLKKEHVIELRGNCAQTFMAADSLIISSAAYHSHNDVKTVLLCTETDYEYFSWIRWLPHCLSAENDMRFAAGSESKYADVLYPVSEELSRRTALRAGGYTGSFFPFYIILCTDERTVKQSAVHRYSDSIYDIGAVFIFISKDTDAAVTDNRTILCMTDDFRGIIRNSVQEKAVFDLTDRDTALAFARRLAGTSENRENKNIIPDRISFFDLNEISDINRFSLISRYISNHAYEGLRINLGLNCESKAFVLDISEKNHGPHGLVAGMTGSGKSEVLQSIILSLAMNYHPDEVSMILIDYKGGGMSQAFEELPHVRGVLTNLDCAGKLSGVTYRVCTAIRNELRKRQELLRKYKLSHADMYMKMYAKGIVSVPLPHIVIIVDEFAELKKENPEFISELVSISRIGRSLGIHLILATQKPAGVIDEQIWSNSSFRICLKVQDKADSIEMLRRPEASTLKTAGRAYVQIGNDEIFELIQTAYSGQMYPETNASHIKMVNTDLSEMVITAQETSYTAAVCNTQRDVCTAFIISTCKENSISALPRVWLEPPGELVDLDDVYALGDPAFSEGLKCAAGIADNIENQKIYPAVIDLISQGSVLIAGGAGSGKTTLLNTMLFSMVTHYSPDKLKIAVIDFDGFAFSCYKKLAHTLNILTNPDEDEIFVFFEKLFTEIKSRKQKFAYGCCTSYREYICEHSDMPSVVVCIDGFYSFTGLFPQFEQKFEVLSRDCCKYGIFMLVSIKHITDMKLRTRRNFTVQAALKLSDISEYAELLSYVPEHGIRDNKGYVYLHTNTASEFQTALIVRGKSESSFRQAVNQVFDTLMEKYSDGVHDPQHYTGNDCLCRCLDVSTVKEYINVSKTLVMDNIPSVQWIPVHDDENRLEGVRTYEGMQGAYDMLLMLRNEFEKRKSLLRPLPVTLRVFIGSLYEFCACIYSRSAFEGMSKITETFFEKAQGYGAEFVSYRDAAGLCVKYRAAELFLSQGKGEEECLIF